MRSEVVSVWQVGALPLHVNTEANHALKWVKL